MVPRGKAAKMIEIALEGGLKESLKLGWYSKIEEILDFPDGFFKVKPIGREQSRSTYQSEKKSQYQADVYNIKMMSLINGVEKEKVKNLN